MRFALYANQHFIKYQMVCAHVLCLPAIFEAKKDRIALCQLKSGSPWAHHYLRQGAIPKGCTKISFVQPFIGLFKCYFFLSGTVTLVFFIDSPIMLLAVNEATILLSMSLPACGELGNKIKLVFVASPIDCKVS